MGLGEERERELQRVRRALERLVFSRLLAPLTADEQLAFDRLTERELRLLSSVAVVGDRQPH